MYSVKLSLDDCGAYRQSIEADSRLQLSVVGTLSDYITGWLFWVHTAHPSEAANRAAQITYPRIVAELRISCVGLILGYEQSAKMYSTR